MARINLYRNEGNSVGKRQLPITSDNLMMLMDLSSRGLSIDSPPIRGKDMEDFVRKFNLLTRDELRQSLVIDSETFLSVLNQCVQCVGCRRRVERLFNQLMESGDPTLDPLVFKNSSFLTLAEEKIQTAQTLGTVLYRHHEILDNVLENKLRNKTRCVMHSMDAFRAKPFSETWRDVWSSMKHNCRDEIAIIEMKDLHNVLDSYLKKHKFCQGCRDKIEKAYKILVGEVNCKDKGFVAGLYANIKKCQEDKHIHIITTKLDFLDTLIRRAEPEVNGRHFFFSAFAKHRERHAKTLEIAQEEVLTCVGMILYERLRRIYVSLREEERACQVLAAVGVHSLYRGFDMAVEKKQGISNLELLYQEISRADRAKQQKRELKKLKKKQKKNEKKNRCDSVNTVEADDEPDEAVDVSGDHELDEAGAEECLATEEPKVEHGSEASVTLSQKKKKKQKQVPKQSKKKSKKKQQQSVISKDKNSANHTLSLPLPEMDLTGKCEECLAATPDCPCDVKDSGYGSEPNSHVNSCTSSAVSSPDGSEVSCSDGFCNHEQNNGNDLDDEQHSMQQCDNETCDSLLCQQRYTLTLQQMLDDVDEYDEIEDNCYIPPEVVLQYQCQREKVQQERLKLRETLRQNFARLCINKGLPPSIK